MKQILCYGDSNTYGLVPGTGERYGWGVRWTSILSEKLGPAQYHIIEEGLCGRTTVFDDPLRPCRNGADLLPAILETHRPVDLVVLMLGTNDCKTIYGASAEVIGKGVRRLIGQVRQTSPDAKILLISPIHLGEQVWQKEFDPEFCRESVEVSRALGDVYGLLAEELETGYLSASDYAASSSVDQEHLDAAGHAALADGICRYLTEHMDVGEQPSKLS